MSDLLVAIHQAVEFVEAYLQEEITVADMASAAGYSLFHFVRTFNKVVHHTPYDYLMRRRLSKAAEALVCSNRKIIDIALDYCFHSPEVFSRAFKRMFAVQPSQYRARNNLDSRFLLSKKTLPYLQHINKDEFSRPVLQQREAFSVVGLMTRLTEGGGVIQQLWESLEREIPDLAKLSCFGIVTYPDDWVERGAFYMAGAVMESSDFASHNLVTRNVPGGDFASFTHVGSLESMALTRDYAYQTWLPKSGRRIAYPLDIECYRGKLGSGYEICQILVPIKNVSLI